MFLVGTPQALDITVRATADRLSSCLGDNGLAARSPGEAMLAEVSDLVLDWMDAPCDADAFAVLCALPAVDQQTLFAAAVARTLKGQLAFELGVRPDREALTERLGMDSAALVRPTADILFVRLTNVGFALDCPLGAGFGLDDRAGEVPQARSCRGRGRGIRCRPASRRSDVGGP